MIEFREVSKTYPDGTVAVGSVSLTVPEGTMTVLVGSSGSGKTTLLRMVNRMVDPTSGSVWVAGRDARDVDPVQLRRSIGYVLQEGGLLPHRSVVDNIATVPMLQGTPRRQARRDAVGLLERVGLDASLAKRYPAQLSGGQRQRVGVARALAADPQVLLMDEPFGAVDPIVRRELQDELVRLQRELNKTIVFVTHDIEEAIRLGDEVVVLAQGGVVAQQGTPAEVLSHPADEFVRSFIGADHGDRQLTRLDNGNVIVDELGRPLGVLAP